MGKFTFSPEMTRKCTDVSASKFGKTFKTMNSVSLTYLSKHIITSVDKDMEKLKPSYNTGFAKRTVEWCSHFGKQPDSS